MANLTVTVRSGEIGRSEVMAIIVRPCTPGVWIHISPIGIIVGDCVIRATPVIGLNVSSIAAIVAMDILARQCVRCDGETKENNAAKR
jgi:hypothetical protein